MRNVIKRERIRMGASAAATRRAAEPARAPHEAGVRLVQLDDGAVAVEYTCKCGEVALFELELEPRLEEA